LKILYGKKTVLLPLTDEDMPHFLQLMDENHQLLGSCFFKSKEAYLGWVLSELKLGRWLVWACWSKSGMAESTKRFGFIVLFDPNPISVSIQGLMDKTVMRGLLKLLHNSKTLTMTEDCLRTLINHAIDELNIHKLDATALESNVTSRKLIEKCGFIHEGKLREGAFIDGHYEAIHQYGLLKSDLQLRSQDEVKEDQRGGVDRSLQSSIN